MIAVAILSAVTEYRMYGGVIDRGGFFAQLGPGTPSKAADSMREVLARPILAGLRCRVRDFGESAFIRGGLPGMHRLMRQVEDRAPDSDAIALVSRWWAGVGAGHAHWLPCQGSAKLRSLPLVHIPSSYFDYRIATRG
jgi:hypothetical protein